MAAFRDTNALLDRLKKKYQIGLISNIDDKLLGATRRHFRVDFDLVVTAQQVRSYKPDPAHFKECKRRIGSQDPLGPHRDRPRDRRDPCIKLKVPVIWVDRKKEERGQEADEKDLRGGSRTEIVKDLPHRP